MSKYTTQVRFICESISGSDESKGFNDIDDIIKKACPKIFNFNFPIFNEDYRLPLEIKILRHYYTREIGEETVGLWKLRLNTRLNEIMPFYNKMYESELLKFDPLKDVDITTKHEKTNKGNVTDIGTEDRTDNNTRKDNGKVINNQTNSGSTESNSDANTTNWDLYSDTPQGAITNIDNETYLTNARKKTNKDVSNNAGSYNNETNDTTTSETENTEKLISNTSKNNEKTIADSEEFIQTILGKTGGTTYSELLKEYRETFLNIDSMIINDLSDLFFGLWE